LEIDLPSPLIAKLEWRHDIPVSMREDLFSLLKRERLLDAGSDFKQASWCGTACSLLVEGVAARYKLMSNGRRQITALHVPGDFVDLASQFVRSRDYEVVALSPCRFALADRDRLQELTEHSAGVTRLLWMDSLIDAAIQQEWLVSMGRRSALEHLAHLVCELFLRLKVVGRTDGFSFRLPLTQADVADVLGLSMVHVNRMLKALRGDEVMTWTNQNVTIVNWGRLREIAEFDPDYLAFRREVA